MNLKKLTNFSNPFFKETFDAQYSFMSCFALAIIVLVGMTLRFWGLGSMGLHGDEDTSAMAALGVLKTGLPLQPSGMFYPRGIAHSYIMAASVWVFGNSEWALRLPSALIGTFGIILAFFLAKRFLTFKWGLLVALIIALDPTMVIWSKTARMYIFLSTFIMLFAILILKWESSDKWIALTAAFITILITTQFHSLAIFSSFLFFYPISIKFSMKRGIQGLTAFASAAVIFLIYQNWVSDQYGETIGDATVVAKETFIPLKFALINFPWFMAALSLLSLAILGISFYSNERQNSSSRFAILILAAGTAACILFEYGIASLLFASGIIVYLRSNGKGAPIVILMGFLCLLLLFQIYLLHYANPLIGFKSIIKTLMGHFSPNTLIDIFQEHGFGSFLYLIPFSYAIIRLVKGQKVPEHFFFFIISVVVPLIAMSYFRWHVASRFLLHLGPFFIISWIAGLLYVQKALTSKVEVSARLKSNYILVTLIAVVFIAPLDLYKSVNIVYGYYYSDQVFLDNKGAACYINNKVLESDDLLIVEDYLMYSYYLKKIDYWLRPLQDAKKYSRLEKGKIVNIYTGVPLIGTDEELKMLLEERNNSVYIIAQNRKLKDDNIMRIIHQYKPDIVYKGLDDETFIWYYPAPSRTQSNVVRRN